MWQDFTNLYRLSKTLRFELAPTDATKNQLIALDIVGKDQARHENFKQAKKVLDEIHRKFISESLDDLSLQTAQLQKFAQISLDRSLKQDAAKQKELIKLREALYSEFAARFGTVSSVWKHHYGFDKFMTSPETQLELIKTFKAELSKKLDMSEAELMDIKTQFDKFTSYFQGYKENRENIYSTNAHATEVAYRTIDQNLLKFYKNIQKYEKFYAESNTLGHEAARYFKIENYINYVMQAQINDYNEAIGRFRIVINQARQGLSKKDKQLLPMFEPLFRQILGDALSANQVLFEKLEDEAEYIELMKKLQNNIPGWIAAIEGHAKSYLTSPSRPENIWLGAKAVNAIIHKNIVGARLDLVKTMLPKEFTSNKRSKDEETAKQSSFVSLGQLFKAINQSQGESEQSILKEHVRPSASASEAIWSSFCDDVQKKIQEARQAAGLFSKATNFTGKNEKEILKKALDSFNDLYRMYGYFELRYKNEPVTSLEIDPDFYTLFEDPEDEDSLFDTDKDKRFSHFYDLIRNYLTKKPYSLDKWKLNFDCSQLLSGWDVNKESEKHGVLLKNSSDYYLAIISSGNSKVFDRAKNARLFDAGTSSAWQKMEYKLLPGPNKMLPKCLLPKSNRRKYGATDEVIDIYEAGSFKKGDNFELAKLHKMIDFYKQAIQRYEGWSMYDFNFKDTKEYQSIDGFYHDVESKGYKLDFVPINANALEKMATEGKIYLFRIQNKDMKHAGSKTPNMHTLYFQALFEQRSKIKLNGEAEIFFRPETKSLPASNTDRKTPQGTPVTELRRFRSDKISLHLPVTINYQAKSLVNTSYNQHALERIKSNKVDAIIGIDRGEKHLAYVAVVNKEGKLLDEPISLNTILLKTPSGGIKTTPYFDLLDAREKERKENRQNWDAVRKIKDIKSGYIGHCVKQIVDLMRKHNAVMALEDLNRGFKQGRSAIEKSVYTQLEQALLHKLQYVVDKSTPANYVFGSQNGVQLAPPDVTPGNTYNHMGFVFFVDPSYTSAVDPVTGYRQHFRLDERVNTRTFGGFIKNGFEKIEYTDGNLLFTFSWRQLASARNKFKKDSRSEKENEISDRLWTVTANVARLVYDKKANESHGATVKRYPQRDLLELFAGADIELQGDIKQQLVKLKPDKKFVNTFVYLFNLINKIRNSDSANNTDAIISPVYQTGFDSTKEKLDGYDWNGDANGAYNIARKGAILLDKLYKAESPKEFKAAVSRSEFDNYISQD